jgi:chloramphenicol-sensitive protein RarD
MKANAGRYAAAFLQRAAELLARCRARGWNAKHSGDNRRMSSGVLQAALAYAMWGLFPLYFQLVSAVPPLEIVLYRSLWSLAFVLVVLAVLRRWAWLRDIVRRPRTLATFALSALLLSANWLVYVWAVNNGRVVDSSLGYFITPLVNVLLGYFVLQERPRRAQWFALAIASAGVLWLTFFAGSLPWVGLVLAATFGIYGLMRKTAPLGALEGLALETLLLAPLAAALLAWRTSHGGSVLSGGDPALLGLLALAGPLTALPLLLFAAGARRIPMTTLGVLQYIGPTIQFALGVWLFHEPFAGPRLVGFAFIWAALVIYTGEGWLSMRRRASTEAVRSRA